MHPAEPLAVYLHLARASAVRQRPLVRDRFLLLAAGEASRLGLADLAEQCRRIIVEHNRGHLLARWGSYRAAAGEPEFQDLLRRTARQFSAEKAEHMLRSLGVVLQLHDVESLASDERVAAFLATFPDPHVPPRREGVLARQRGGMSRGSRELDEIAGDFEGDEAERAGVKPSLAGTPSRMFEPALGFPLIMFALFALAALIVWLLANNN